MSERPGGLVPHRVDLSELVRTSVATLYSHLITRPTGKALRLGIESQIEEIGAPCVSVLDFSQVVVLDYSCADEAVAKLVRRFRPEGRPADAYFIGRGIGDDHRETIRTVLDRHGLTLVARGDDAEPTLLGRADPLEHAVWSALETRGRAGAAEIAAELPAADADVRAALDALVDHRVVVREEADNYSSLGRLL